MSAAQIIVTGRFFTGQGLRAAEPVIQELVTSAREEIQILAYLISESAIPLLQLLRGSVERGVKLTLILNNYDGCSQSVKDELVSLQRFGYAKVMNFNDPQGSLLHAKVLIADRKRAIFGSANFSWGGLVANHEIGVLLEGDPAWALAGIIDSLVEKLRT